MKKFKQETIFKIISFWIVILIIWSYFLNGNYVVSIDYGLYPSISYIILILFLTLMLIALLFSQKYISKNKTKNAILTFYTIVIGMITIMVIKDTIVSTSFLNQVVSFK